MSLLDGKYEIISQRPLGEHSLFEATAADGTTVRIIWYDLQTPDQEAAFEHYRQALRALRRENLAAIYELVSRPGAHYVAWHAAPVGKAAPWQNNEAVAKILQEHGYSLQEADIRADGVRHSKVYGLAFEGKLPPQPTVAQAKVIPQEKQAPQKIAASGLERIPDNLLGWLLGFTLLLTSTGLLLVSFIQSSNDLLLTIPELLGQNVNTAADKLYRLGLAVETEALPSDKPIGEVIDLDPDEGSQLRPGRSVRLRYAMPPGQFASVKVPSLQNYASVEELRRELEQAGLRLGRVARVYANVPQGSIMAQSPPANSFVAQGSSVDILLSEGPQGNLTFLPDLRGLQREDAIFLARVAGIRTPIEEERLVNSKEKPGTVIGQNISPYIPIRTETATLRLVIAGEADLEVRAGVPNFTGMSQEEAQNIAQNYDLDFEIISEPNLPEGIVLQNPVPGTTQRSGTVLLTLNVHPVALPIPVPDIEVRRPRLRRVPYRWFIEPGIPETIAEVSATTLEGQTTLVRRSRVRGGEIIEGEWLTIEPGPITFTLTLGGQAYSEPLRVNP